MQSPCFRTRNRLLRLVVLLGSLLGMRNSLLADAGPPVLLYPEGAPGAVGTEELDQPAIRIYPAPTGNNTGTAVVICPGGGYGGLAMDHEGHHVAQWLNSIGVTGVVLKYRLGPRYHHPAPLQDVQRALRYVRAHADELGVAADRVGVMGFSAGGHLASTVSTRYDAGEPSAADPVQRAGCRPDFSILAYPVISLKSEFGHKGSVKNLLGDNPDPNLLEFLSNETQVTEDTPPTFIFHTAEDKGVPVQNGLVYYSALIANGVPAELHVYQNGPHGVGLGVGDPVLFTWKERLHDWLRENGFLATVHRAAVRGEIKLNGRPVTRGMIAFRPVRKDAHEAERLPIAFASIARGRYEVPENRGAVIGGCRVEITAFDNGPAGPAIATTPRLLKQDKESLMFEIVAGDNKCDLDLETGK